MEKILKIHAVLDDDYNPVIHALGRSGSGYIIRDFLVPDDMPLWALHYALEKAFGFLNEHLHAFRLLDDDFNNINNNSAATYRKNIGKWFKSPSRMESEDFWCDDYKSGSFNNWIRKKYTGPYIYKGNYPSYQSWQDDFDEYLSLVGDDFLIYETKGKYAFKKIIPLRHLHDKQYSVSMTTKFDELLLENVADLFEYNPKDLLETLTVGEIYEKFTQFRYLYDYGDGWEVNITLSDDVSLDDQDVVVKTYRPLMISYDGLNLVEDVGGIGGYMDFLFTIYNLKEVRPTSDSSCYKIEGRFFKQIIDIDGYEYYGGDLSPERTLNWAKSLEWDERLPQIDKWF